MARFLILPRENPDVFAGLSPGEMQAIIERYMAWSAGVGDHLESGEKLLDGAGRVLRGQGDSLSVTDGPYAEAKEVVGGFWIVTADDLAEAESLLDGHPHLEFGSIEIREIEVWDQD